MDVLKVKVNGQWVGIPSIKGEQGETGPAGQNGSDGADGVTFTPSVDSSGNLSWSNDGGRQNPETVNIKGPKGEDYDPADIQNLQKTKAPIIVAEKFGNPVVIEDGISGFAVNRLKVSFAPKQAGTGDPAPDNVRPISGMTGVSISRTGKNLLHVDDSLKLAFNSNYNNWTSTNGVVTITGNATGGYIMPCLPSMKYAYSFETTYRGDDLSIRVYEFSDYPVNLTDGSLIYNSNTSEANHRPPVTFTTTATGKWLVVGFYGHHGSGNNIVLSNIQVELGESASAFEPYSGETIPVVFPAMGKNLLEIAESNILYISNNVTTTFGNSGAVTVTFPQGTSLVTFKIKEITSDMVGKTYAYSGTNIENSQDQIVICDADGGNRSQKGMAYTIAAADVGRTLAVRLWRNLQSGEQTVAYSNIQLEEGSSATAFEPYTNTVYGGELDALTGVLMVTHVMWTKNTATMNNGENYPGWRDCGIRDLIGEGINQSFLNQIVNVGKSYSANTNGDNDILFLSYGQYGKTETEWKALALDVQIAVELTTPQTYQLDPETIMLLEGTNVFITDGDGLVIDYPVDTKKYVDAAGSDVKDVRIAGASILDDGVAIIPFATNVAPGLVKVNSDYGLLMRDTPNQNTIMTFKADSGNIKAGTQKYKPIVPANQHESAFYGLAKLAGVDLANESVTLGQFPNNVKKAIANMLGIGQIYSPMERIADYTVVQDAAEVDVKTDIYGNPFKLAHAQVIFVLGTGVSTINDYFSASMYDQNDYKRGMPTLRAINGSKTWFVHNFMSFGGIGLCFGKASSSGNTQTTQLSTFNNTNEQDGAQVINVTALTGVYFKQYSESTSPILAGSRIIIYGCRVIE